MVGGVEVAPHRHACVGHARPDAQSTCAPCRHHSFGERDAITEERIAAGGADIGWREPCQVRFKQVGVGRWVQTVTDVLPPGSGDLVQFQKMALPEAPVGIGAHLGIEIADHQQHGRGLRRLPVAQPQCGRQCQTGAGSLTGSDFCLIFAPS